MKKMLLIVNPCAGKRAIVGLLPKVTALLAQGGWDADVKFTLARGDAARWVRELHAGYDLIACCGGDGTLNECITGAMALPPEERPALGYIPSGSTNDFANSLHIPAGILPAAKALAGGEPHRLDVGRFQDRYFSYVASFGAFTKSSYSTPQSMKNAIGHLAYILDGARSIGSIRSTELSVEADGFSEEGKFIFGGVCNSTSMGGVVKIKEDLVDFSDGLLELVLIRHPRNPAELARTVRAVTSGTFRDDCILFRHCRAAAFRMKEPAPWTLDGEFAEGAAEISVACAPGAITLTY